MARANRRVVEYWPSSSRISIFHPRTARPREFNRQFPAYTYAHRHKLSTPVSPIIIIYSSSYPGGTYMPPPATQCYALTQDCLLAIQHLGSTIGTFAERLSLQRRIYIE